MTLCLAHARVLAEAFARWMAGDEDGERDSLPGKPGAVRGFDDPAYEFVTEGRQTQNMRARAAWRAKFLADPGYAALHPKPVTYSSCGDGWMALAFALGVRLPGINRAAFVHDVPWTHYPRGRTGWRIGENLTGVERLKSCRRGVVVGELWGPGDCLLVGQTNATRHGCTVISHRPATATAASSVLTSDYGQPGAALVRADCRWKGENYFRGTRAVTHVARLGDVLAEAQEWGALVEPQWPADFVRSPVGAAALKATAAAG